MRRGLSLTLRGPWLLFILVRALNTLNVFTTAVSSVGFHSLSGVLEKRSLHKGGQVSTPGGCCSPAPGTRVPGLAVGAGALTATALTPLLLGPSLRSWESVLSSCRGRWV